MASASSANKASRRGGHRELLGGEIGELVDAVAGTGVGRVEGIDAIQVILWMIDHSSILFFASWLERKGMGTLKILSLSPNSSEA